MNRSSDNASKRDSGISKQSGTSSTNIYPGALSTEANHTVVKDESMMKKTVLSTDEISQCLHAGLNMNLTVDHTIRISYFQYPLNSHNTGLAIASAANASTTHYSGTTSNCKQNFPSDQRGNKNSATLTPSGLCFLSIEAPPGKVLSILFLNQTCSHDNQVRVIGSYHGTSVLNGCLPRKAPGYDVTTVNTSATVVIDLKDLVQFYRLEISVVAMADPIGNWSFVRYVSPVFGYVQTTGWSPFGKYMHFRIAAECTSSVQVPWNHAALVSLVNIFVISASRLKLFTIDSYHKKPFELWYVFYFYPKLAVLTNLTQFRLTFTTSTGRVFIGYRVLFSFHQPQLIPQRTERYLLNCSVPFWSDFYQHVACNHRAECDGQEDEKQCPVTTCQQGGFLIEDSCYIYHFVGREGTWLSADTKCKQLGAVLASFPTMKSWYHLALLLQPHLIAAIGADKYIFIGFRSADATLPHMYRSTGQWSEGTISHYTFYSKPEILPSCGHIRYLSLNWADCAKPFMPRRFPSVHALCQISLASNTEVIEKKMRREKIQSHATPKSASLPKSAQLRLNTDQSPWKRLPLSILPCPLQHQTQQFLACDADSACWFDYDEVDDALNDVAAKVICTDGGSIPVKAMYACTSRSRLVPYTLVCDHLQDCMDNSDEDFCVFPVCHSLSSQYKCANGQCVEYHQHCDTILQCVDGSDETDCSGRFAEGIPPFPPQIANFNGDGIISYTPLVWNKEGRVACPDTHFFCPVDGYCLPVYVRCNNVLDCPGHEDEVGCDGYTCPGFYRCRGSLGICLHPDHLCDGWAQCPQHDDERYCNMTCPADCNCLGHAFTCTGDDFQVNLFSRLRYLDAGGTGLKPERLRFNVMLVCLSLAACGLEHLGNLSLPNLLSLDLSDNRLSVVTVAELNQLKNLQNLSLAGNPLSGLFPGNVSSTVNEVILHLNLANVKLETLDVRSGLPFSRLLSLNMSETGVTRLRGDGFQSMSSLVTLDLRGCPMTDFPRDTFLGLKALQLVFAENYKLCCPDTLPGGFNEINCHAQFDEVSSCDALLRSDVYRVCLSVLAALALVGNLGCFCLRVFSLTGGGKTGFNVFVTHLCVSDFVMGVYLVMIGIADRLYLGSYLWEDSRWRHGSACKVAGVLALLSSEVSALIICLITLDRFLVIRFPFSGLRFSQLSAHVACFVTWIAGLTLVVVPLLPVLSFWKFYGQTGICVPLPITKGDFAGHHYSFGVMILLNLVVFLLIAAGQVSVYLSMMSNAMTSNDQSRKSRDLIVARRLITVVVSDFLCWFPLGLLGVLAAQGVPVPGELNVVMAIFVMPLNSALNPFLYTLNMIQEKRLKAKEETLLKMIMNRKKKEEE